MIKVLFGFCLNFYLSTYILIEYFGLLAFSIEFFNFHIHKQVLVRPVQNSGTLPIICQSIVDIAMGSVIVRSRLQRPLDSYQEEDLAVLREKWTEALERRKQYLNSQIQKIDKKGKIFIYYYFTIFKLVILNVKNIKESSKITLQKSHIFYI